MAGSRGRYPPEYKEQIVELVRSGRSPGSLAREFEPSEQTIRNWVKQADLDEGRRSDGLTTEARLGEVWERLNRGWSRNRALKLARVPRSAPAGPRPDPPATLNRTVPLRQLPQRRPPALPLPQPGLEHPSPHRVWACLHPEAPFLSSQQAGGDPKSRYRGSARQAWQTATQGPSFEREAIWFALRGQAGSLGIQPGNGAW